MTASSGDLRDFRSQSAPLDLEIFRAATILRILTGPSLLTQVCHERSTANAAFRAVATYVTLGLPPGPKLMCSSFLLILRHNIGHLLIVTLFITFIHFLITLGELST